MFMKGKGAIFKNCTFPFFLFTLLTTLTFSGCTPASYSGDKLKEAISEIAQKEYGIDQCEVRINGATLGVFLPLKQLFAMDFKEALLSGKVTNMEQLFQPTEEAVDRVEDMLFSMARVMLSTNKKIDFYYLQATDKDKTGMQLSFLGNTDDVKKVRFWDIPRSEYRKRVIHELQMNRAILWHRPVQQFFVDINHDSREEIRGKYFSAITDTGWTKEFFFNDSPDAAAAKSATHWEIMDMRSLPVRDGEVVVYTKVKAVPRTGGTVGKAFEYLFQISVKNDKEAIFRIIPMSQVDQLPQEAGLPLTKEMIRKSLNQWESEFEVPDMTMGEFLALQLTRRIQAEFSANERIYNTFSSVKCLLKYEANEPVHFSLLMTAPLKGLNEPAFSAGGILHEDVLYLWETAAREFVTVIRSYGFNDWQYLDFSLTQAQAYLWKASKDDLELFRRNKKPLADILAASAAA